MKTIEELANGTQLLGNLDEVLLNDNIPYLDVEIGTYGMADFFVERLYPDEAGRIVLYSLGELLKPYCKVASVTYFYIHVDYDSSGTTYGLHVLYATAEVKIENEDVDLMLHSRFLTTAIRRRTTMKSIELLPVYVGEATTIEIDVRYQYYLRSVGVASIETDMYTQTIPVSGNMTSILNDAGKIVANIADQKQIPASDIVLVGYMLSYDDVYDGVVYTKRSQYSVELCESRCRHCFKFRNLFGLEETVTLFGSEKVEPSYELLTARIKGHLQSIDQQMRAEHSVTVDYPTAMEASLIEQLILSTETYHLVGDEWQPVVVTNGKRPISETGSANNSVTVEWTEPRSNHQRAVFDMPTNRVFEPTFEQTMA